MGNLHSSSIGGGSNNYNNVDFIEKLDSIVSHYILSMDFQNLKKLHDKEYCNKLVNLTADILNRRFSEVELKKIEERIDPESRATGESRVTGENYATGESRATGESDKLGEKQSLCIDIAKFYIKIAHLFSAILTTINPEYTYTDSDGNRITKKFQEKDTIPKDAIIEQINSGLCDNKIKTLSEAPLENPHPPNKKSTCYLNIFSSNKASMLSDEPGIPELKDLYYDAEYDLKSGEFKGMSTETKEQYKRDVQQFYKTFTQETAVPDSIQSFSDIKLTDYSKTCDRPVLREEMKPENKLLREYANNLRNMLKYVGDKQGELLKTINALFVVSNNDIKINPTLTEELLDQWIATSRTLIVELYLKCETDFLEGIKIYEAIVELQILKTTEKQIVALGKEKEKLYR